VVWTGGAGIELIAGDLSQSLDLSDELPQTESRDDLPEFSINVEAENQTLGGSVTVAFEEVLVSEAGSLTVYDDFEGDHLDPELWAEGDEQWVVADSALGLVHTGRSTGASLRCPWLFDEMAVDVTVLEDEGAAAGVGAAGMLFSDGDGLVVAAALADGDEAYYQVLRFTGDEIPEELARESLAPIELGSTHMLYYGWDGEQFAFQLDDDEVVTVDPDGIGLGSARDDVGQRAAWVGVLEVGGAGSARLQAVVDNVRALPDGACDYEPPEYCVLDEDSLLADGEFSRGLSCWHQWPDDYVTTSADHPAETTDPSVKIDNWSGSLDEFTQVLQTGFTLEAGHSYRLSFWARGFTDDSWVRVWVQQWTPPAGFFWEDVPLTTEWQLVERTFTSPEDAVDGVMEFQVFMDGAPPVWIDGVVLQEL